MSDAAPTSRSSTVSFCRSAIRGPRPAGDRNRRCVRGDQRLVIDLEPRPRLGSLATGTALLAGLGLGAFCTALLVQYAPDPLRLVFWLLTGLYAIAFAAIFAEPDRVPRTSGAIASLRPAVSVPASARWQFAASTPSSVAIWALAGLYLSLGPALVVALSHSLNRVVGGLVILALAGGGAATSAVVQSIDPRTLIVRASLVVVVGVAGTLLTVIETRCSGSTSAASSPGSASALPFRASSAVSVRSRRRRSAARCSPPSTSSSTCDQRAHCDRWRCGHALRPEEHGVCVRHRGHPSRSDDVCRGLSSAGGPGWRLISGCALNVVALGAGSGGLRV